MAHRISALLKAAFWLCLAAVFVLAVMPGRLDPIHVWDKAKHFAAFFTLGLLAALAFPRQKLVILGAALSAFGAAIELVQALPIVHRDCDIRDWIADTLAVVLILAFVAVAHVRQRVAAVLAKVA